MGAVKQLANKKVLKNLIPLNALTSSNLEKIVHKAVIEEVRSGRFVFKQGDRDNHTVYLLQGSLTFLAENREVDEISAESPAALHPIAHFQPRQVSARANTNVVVARIDTNLLDVMLTWDQSSGYEVTELQAEDDADWMTKMLQSQALQKLPPSNIQKLIMRMQELQVGKGETVIRQGDVGEDYFIIKAGRCEVTRTGPHGQVSVLAELGDGDSFGEDALLSNELRNASVTMTTDGVLMRLAKQDFLELLKSSLINQIDYQQAALLSIHGAVWLDVRLPEEFQHSHISGAVNIPLAGLRRQWHSLDGSKQYIVYCDTGRRSASATFLLSQKGLNVQVLAGGISRVPEKDLGNGKTQSAEIIHLNEGRRRTTVEPVSAVEIENLSGEIERLTGDVQDVPLARNTAKRESGDLQQTSGENQRFTRQMEQLQRENEKYKNDIEQMEREADSAQTMFDKRLKAIDQELNETKQKSEQYAAQLQQLSTLQQEIEAQRTQLHEKNKALEAVQAKLAQAQSVAQNHAAKSQSAAAAAAQLQTRELELEQVRARLTAAESARAASETAQKQTGEELQKLREQLHATQDTRGKREAELNKALEEKSALAASLQLRLDEAKRDAEAAQNAGMSSQKNVTLELKNKLDTADARIAELFEMLDKARNEQHETQEKNSQLTEKNRHLQQEIIDLREQSGKLAQTQAQNEDSELAARYKAESQQLQNQLTGKEAELVALNVELQHVHTAADQAREALKRAESERANMASKLNTLESQHVQEINDLTTRLADSREKFHNLQLSKQEFKENENKLKMQVKVLESDLSVSNNRLANYKHEFELITKELHKAKEQLRGVHALEQKFQAEKELVAADNAKLEGESSRLKSEIREWNEKFLEALREKAESEVSKNVAEEKLAQIKQEYDHALKAAHEENVRAEYEVARLRAEHQLLQKKLSQLEIPQEQNGVSQEEFNHLNEEVVSLRAELQAAKTLVVEQSKRHETEMADKERQAEAAMQRHLQDARKRQDDDAKLQQAHIRKELDSTITEQSHLKNEVKQWQLKYADLEAKSRSAKEEIEDLKGELDVWKNLSSKNNPLNKTWNNAAPEKEELDDLFNDNEIPEIKTRVPSQVPAKVDESDDWLQMEKSVLEEPRAAPAVARVPSQAPAMQATHTSTVSSQTAFKTSRTQAASVQSGPLDNRNIVAKHRMKKRLVRVGVWAGMLVVIGAAIGASYVTLGQERVLRLMQRYAGVDLTAQHPPANQAAGDSTMDAGKPETNKAVTPSESKNKEPKNKSKATAGAVGKSKTAPIAAVTAVDSRPAAPREEAVILHGVDVQETQKSSEPRARGGSDTSNEPNQLAVLTQPLAQAAIRFKPQMAILNEHPRLVYQDLMRNDSKGPVLVEIPGGEYIIGNSDPNAPLEEQPAHQISVSAFSMTQKEITLDEYDAFAKATKRMLPKDSGFGRGNRPVIHVSWYDAKAYAEWISDQTQQHYRLPSEAEWELAAAATQTNKTRYWWGDDIGAGNANCFNCGTDFDGKKTAPVGSFQPNAFGLYDTSGNVAEWTEDCYHPNFQGAPGNGLPWAGGDCSLNVVRGGAYISTADELRTNKRAHYSPSTKLDSVGIRLVREH